MSQSQSQGGSTFTFTGASGGAGAGAPPSASSSRQRAAAAAKSKRESGQLSEAEFTQVMAGLDLMPSEHPAVENAAKKLREGTITEEEYGEIESATYRLQQMAKREVQGHTKSQAPHLVGVLEALEEFQKALPVQLRDRMDDDLVEVSE